MAEVQECLDRLEGNPWSELPSGGAPRLPGWGLHVPTMFNPWLQQPPRKQSLGVDMVEPFCNRNSTDCDSVSVLTHECGLSYRPAQLFHLAHCKTELRTMCLNALGGHDELLSSVHNVGCNSPNCIVFCVTHLSLRDNESESSPRVIECESLNSAGRLGGAGEMVPGRALWRCLTFRARRYSSL